MVVTNDILITAALAASMLLLLKIVWRVIWGVINWTADKRLRSSDKKSIYETLIPMVDYIPFYDLFADEETIERRALANSTRQFVRQRIRGG